MNQHLRFPVGLIAFTAMLSSCSTTPEPPQEPPLAKGQIRYHVHLFSTDEILDVTNSFPGIARVAGIYSSDEGAKLLQRYQKNKAFERKADVPIVGKNSQRVSYSQLTNFRYPTEYSPPVYSKTPGAFPVTPPTPRKVESKQLGTQVSLRGKRVGEDSLSVSFQFEKKSLLGNVNYGEPITANATDFWGRKVKVIVTENKMLVPVFREFKLNSDFILQNRQYILIEGNGSHRAPKVKPLDKSAGPVEPANFVALIQVEAGP